MKISIDLDPSSDPYIDYKNFINYLLNKQLFVEVYDAEKLFLIGFLKIPLKDLLRQGKSSIHHTKEYEIYNDKFTVKGSVQVLIKSIGLNTQKTYNYDSNALKVVNTKDKFMSTNQKKKVRVKPLDVEKVKVHF